MSLMKGIITYPENKCLTYAFYSLSKDAIGDWFCMEIAIQMKCLKIISNLLSYGGLML